jgi:hypothetical protein
MGRIIGKGWCVIIQDDCWHSEGHGADGLVMCTCMGVCPKGVES